MKKEELETLVRQGLTNVEIGKVFGLNRNTIARNIKKFEIYKEKIHAHPNLKIDFFENIDSKEKAYWLGFLYADGYISKRNETVIALSKKDVEQVENFCNSVGANKEKIKARTHPCESRSVSIKISSVKFTNYIIKQGCVNAKSKIIKLPDFNDDNLDLAFLSGYYDGDGAANSCELYCGSKEFLQQIKNKYNIKFEVKKKDRVFLLNLGADFKRKIIKNYPECMERKKNTFAGDRRNKLKGINPNIRRGENLERFKTTKEELELLMKQYPNTKIAKMFGVSGKSIEKRAKKLGIQRESRRGYWTKVKNKNKEV